MFVSCRSSRCRVMSCHVSWCLLRFIHSTELTIFPSLSIHRYLMRVDRVLDDVQCRACEFDCDEWMMFVGSLSIELFSIYHISYIDTILSDKSFHPPAPAGAFAQVEILLYSLVLIMIHVYSYLPWYHHHHTRVSQETDSDRVCTR